MASLRSIKKDIDYLVTEVVADAYLALYFNSAKQEEVVGIMTEAVDLRNNLFEAVNNPSDKRDSKLVRKHYTFIREEMFSKIDALLTKLSEIVQG